MVVEIPPFDVLPAVIQWLVTMIVCAVVALVVGFVASLAAFGAGGPRVTSVTLSRGFRDLFLLSGKRIGAIATLTFKEAQRRKAFMIGFLFVLLFMFGGWFLGNADQDQPAKPFITFVLTSMYFLLILMALLVACWGLPADIKARSLHTVVTKPVRRSEIVIGRMLGYLGVVTVVLLVTAVLGYFWILMKVPPRAAGELIARVPEYGEIHFLDRNGNPGDALNVGDIWGYRGFIEGGTNARAIWTFKNLDVPRLKQAGQLRLESSFEAFRTYKGDIRQQLRYNLTLVNPDKDLRVLVGAYDVNEFARGADVSTVEIPAELTYRDSYELNAPEKKVNVFDDLIHNGTLTVEISALETQQYIGASRYDLFIRMPDRSFLGSYTKACLGLWLLLALIVIVGTASSCFVKGPVATILTGSLIFVGFVFREKLGKTLEDVATTGSTIGGGSFESTYRLLTQMNETSPLPENLGTDVIKALDQGVFGILRVVAAMIPNLEYFNTSQYPANGFDVPWDGMLWPSVLITLAYLIPLIILGYFSLQLRELEHK